MPNELTINQAKSMIRMRAAYMAIDFDDTDIAAYDEPTVGTFIWLSRYKVMTYPNGYDEPGEWQYWPNVWLDYVPDFSQPVFSAAYGLRVKYPHLMCRIGEGGEVDWLDIGDNSVADSLYTLLQLD